MGFSSPAEKGDRRSEGMAELPHPRGLHRPQGPAGAVLLSVPVLEQTCRWVSSNPVTRSHVHPRAFLKQMSSLSPNP